MRGFAAAAMLAGAVLQAGCAAPRAAAPAVPLDHLPALAGDYFRIDSGAVGRPFHIYVRLPEGYAEAPDRRYPVVYLLDGDSLFPILAANHLFLQYDEALPEAVVVGIAYGSFDPAVNRRDVDFVPPDPEVPPGRAGAPAFLRFMEDELLPAVEGRFRADPRRRILFGQSRGGAFVLYSAFVDPDLFWGRIASNPSLRPGRAIFFGEPSAAARDDLGLIVASGSREPEHRRAAVLGWAAHWQERGTAPWALHLVTIEGGTHAANSADAYRAGLLRLFGPARAAGAPSAERR